MASQIRKTIQNVSEVALPLSFQLARFPDTAYNPRCARTPIYLMEVHGYKASFLPQSWDSDLLASHVSVRFPGSAREV
jgi:hypothetical protein